DHELLAQTHAVEHELLIVDGDVIVERHAGERGGSGGRGGGEGEGGGKDESAHGGGLKRPQPALNSIPMDFLQRSFSIGGVRIEQPLALAPMAEVTDTYYRSLIKELGGVGLVVSEFISAEGLTRKNDRSHQMLAFSENERPVAIQIYGGDPERMDDAAAIVEAQGVDIVDINMGCPVKKIVNTGAGSGMLRDFDKAARTVDKI